MNKLFKKSFIVFLALLISGISQFACADQLKNIQQKQKVTQEKIKKLKNLEKLEKNKMFKNQQKLEQASNSLQTSKTRYSSLEAQLAQLERDLNKSAAEFNSANVHMRSRIRQVYKHQRKGMFELALEDYNRALEIDSNYVVSYIGQGNMYYRLGNYWSAIDSYTQVIHRNTEYVPMAYLWRGMSYKNLGENQRAIADLRKTLELEPDNATALNGMGYVLACGNRDLTQALSYCKRALDKAPASAACLDSIGWVYFKLGLKKDAERYLSQAQALLPDNPDIAEHIRLLQKDPV